MSSDGATGLRVAIVGCGLVGRKRAEAIGQGIIGCYDIDDDRSKALANDFGATVCSSLDEVLALRPDVVVVATVHSALANATRSALDAGSHVLVEKPAGMGIFEVEQISDAARRARRLVKVGFNHRFYPGIERAITEARSGDYGEILYVRARYGHGGRLGYASEWRTDPSLSGGGEIIDQGMHLLDLTYALLGELPLHSSLLRTQFWDAPVDDNAVLLLGQPGGVGSRDPFALLHVSWTEWKNTFSLEIACREAKISVDGLVRSYGPQVLRLFRMRSDLGIPDLEEIQYPDRDLSFELEWQHFAGAIMDGDDRPLRGDLESARFAWSIVEAAQRQ